MTNMTDLKILVATLPQSPGVYQFIDSDQKIIYVGKAKNLRNRVASYFNSGTTESFKTKLLAKQIHDIKHIVVDSEADALLLENNLIKKYQPKYNVLLKDDKTFPWICIKKEPFPRVFSTRKLERDGSEYFGPYTSALMVKTLLTLVRQLYQLRTCNYLLTPENIHQHKYKRCLEYHIGNCKAPCENLQSEEDYDSSIQQIRKILKGNIQEVISHLEQIMKKYASDYKFEEAEKIKQKISLLNRFKSKSTIVNPKINNTDVFSYFEKSNKAYVNFLKIVSGAIVQSHTVELISRLDEPKEKLFAFAILDIRNKVNSNAREIIASFMPEENIPDARLTVPRAGDKKKLLELSERNAKQYYLHKQKIQEKKNYSNRNKEILEKAKADLQLKQLPDHIECFDNSNIQGEYPVAACVVFRGGKPARSEYRHYNVKTVTGPDDYASMKEVVYRRYKRLQDEGKDLPQLVVIDGGKGQLNAAVSSIKELNLFELIPVIGIAKRLEEIYYPNDPVPLYIDKNSPTLKLIQHLRNEAHRFGINFHRNKRSTKMVSSSLEEIKGIGKQTIEKLIREIGSVEKIKSSSPEVIEKIIGKAKTKILMESFRNA